MNELEKKLIIGMKRNLRIRKFHRIMRKDGESLAPQTIGIDSTDFSISTKSNKIQSDPTNKE